MGNVSIVISSCDLYSDCWKPMFLSLQENWGNSDLPIYLICNFKDSGNERVKALKVGEHLGWGSNTKKAMGMIESDYILLLQEDYFLNAPMSDLAILKHVEFMKSQSLDYLRIGPTWYDNLRKKDNPDYCYSPADRPFAMCLQPAIWKKSTLEKLAVPGWTGWDYERNIHKYIADNHINSESGGVKSMVIHSSLSATEGYNMVHGTAIRKGIWTEGGIEFLERHGFMDEIKGRKREGKLLTILNDWSPNSPFILPVKVLRKTIQTIKRKF